MALRAALRRQEPSWFNAPVPDFGDRTGRLAIVGLAPGLRGANRTGRPFTGDWAGRLLYETLTDFGFAVGRYDERPDDGLKLVDCIILNSVRCVPPQNKPTSLEIRTCSEAFLRPSLDSMSNLRIIVALGRIAHDAALRMLRWRASQAPFAHGARHALAGEIVLFDSYHCSRYNTNTGVLTRDMFRQIFFQARAWLDDDHEKSQTVRAK